MLLRIACVSQHEWSKMDWRQIDGNDRQWNERATDECKTRKENRKIHRQTWFVVWLGRVISLWCKMDRHAILGRRRLWYEQIWIVYVRSAYAVRPYTVEQRFYIWSDANETHDLRLLVCLFACLPARMAASRMWCRTDKMRKIQTEPYDNQKCAYSQSFATHTEQKANSI